MAHIKHFTPSEFDEIKKVGSKEKIPAYLFVDPDEPETIIIRLNPDISEILDNSEYTIKLPALTFEDGDVQVGHKETFVTEPSPIYVDLKDVKVLCRDLPISDEDIIIHIRNVCSELDYWMAADVEVDNYFQNVVLEKATIKEKYYPFFMFIIYRSAAEALREFYIGAVSRPFKFEDTISDLTRKEEMDLDAIKDLLDDLERKADEWLEELITTAESPVFALRAKYCYAIQPEGYVPYHNTFIDRKGNSPWNRGY